jgi:tetratricopeptide (TPR) repeat protein
VRARFPALSFAAVVSTVVVVVVIVVAHRLGAAVPANTPAVLNPAIRELFDQLVAADPRQREQASESLANYGDLIRPALVDASRDEDGSPELRARAQRLLCGLPWSRPDDPPPVRQILSNYRSTDPDARANAVRGIVSTGDAAVPTLLRLLDEEPSVEVRWVIVGQLHRLLQTATADPDRRRFQPLEGSDDAPHVAVAAWARHFADPDRALRLFRRAVDLFALHPCNDAGELDSILRVLYVRAINAGDYDEAVGVMRTVVRFGERPLSEGMLDVFALHAQYGARRGFETDVRVAETCFYTPEMSYVLGRMYERMGQPLLATACYRAAGLSGLASQAMHKRLADFLLTRQWYELAQTEFRAVLATTGPEKDVQDADAYVGLSRCAAALGDDAAAADLLTSGLRIAASLPGRSIINEAAFRAEIEWHQLRAAKARGDLAAVARHVDKLLPRAGGGNNNNNSFAILENPELAIDLVAGLKALGRNGKAADVFEQAYAKLQEELRQLPHEPEVLNNIAWLCARCDERVDEAVNWSAEAVRLAPANAAYLDTAAEAVAHQGKWQQAIDLESAALRLQPGDRFMTAQLLHFREELAKSKGN